MKKTLYLHIGTPKTGTTSLQRFLGANAELLQNLGFAYPISEFKYPHVQRVRNAHFLVGKLYHNNEETQKRKRDKKREAQLQEEGMSMVHAAFLRFPNVILSDEHIWRVTGKKHEAMWKHLAEDAQANDYEIKVIVYLRRQDGYMYSWLSQLTKTANSRRYATVGWEELKQNEEKMENMELHLDYYAHLESIAAYVGKENITVRVFDRSKFRGMGNTIYSDFLQCVGLEFTDAFVLPPAEANSSLTGNRQEIMRVLNILCDGDDDLRSHMRGLLHEAEANKNPLNKFEMYDPQELQAFLADYADSNQAVAREYMGETEAPLFDGSIKKGELWTPNNAYMPEDLLRLMIPLYLEQRAEIAALKEKLSLSEKALKERIRKVEQCSFFFRLRRKCRYLLGKLRGQ